MLRRPDLRGRAHEMRSGLVCTGACQRVWARMRAHVRARVQASGSPVPVRPAPGPPPGSTRPTPADTSVAGGPTRGRALGLGSQSHARHTVTVRPESDHTKHRRYRVRCVVARTGYRAPFRPAHLTTSVGLLTTEYCLETTTLVDSSTVRYTIRVFRLAFILFTPHDRSTVR
jgi:hypothetical protein